MKTPKKRKEGGGGPGGGNSDTRAGKVSRNAFEVLGNKKLRREVAGRKVKGSERNLISSAEKDRKQVPTSEFSLWSRHSGRCLAGLLFRLR